MLSVAVLFRSQEERNWQTAGKDHCSKVYYTPEIPETGPDGVCQNCSPSYAALRLQGDVCLNE